MSTQSHWATHFYVGRVKDHGKVLDTFLPIIEDDNNFIQPWIYSKCKSTCQHPNNLNLPWDVFYNAIKPNMEEYLESLRPSSPYKISSSEVWLNVYEEGGYQELHDHAFPNRAFSCAYMLEIPEGDACGKLVFENTNFSTVQLTGINRIFDAFNYEKFIPDISSGTLVIFPSWAKHYVLPNNTNRRRTTISANFTVEGVYK